MNLRKTLLALALGGALTVAAAPLALAEPTATPDATSSATPTAAPSTSTPAKPTPSEQPTQAPAKVYLGVVPQSVGTKQALTIEGTGFQPGAKLRLSVALAGTEDQGTDYSATADRDGAIKVRITAPSVAGEYAVLAQQGLGNTIAETTLKVTNAMSLTVSPSSVKPSQKVRVFGSGYELTGKAKVVVAVADSDDPGKTYLATMTNGGFDITINAPAEPGNYTVIVMNEKSKWASEGTIVIQKPLTVSRGNGTNPTLPSTGN